MKRRKSKFGAILFDAVYEGLSSIGTSIPSAILPHLEKEGSIGPGRVVNNPVAFDEGLRNIFGFGATIIEKRILEVLCEKLRIHARVEENFNFPKKVQNLYDMLQSTEVQMASLETVNV